MATCTLQNVFDLSRAKLRDTLVSGGATFTNTILQPHFGTAWRRVWRAMANSGSKRVQHSVEINLPANTTVLIPSTYNINDFSEPEVIEERQAAGTLAVTSTDTSTPINVTLTAGTSSLGSPGGGGYCVISGVANTSAPWGFFGFTIVDSNRISLNGSASDGNAGTGGTLTLNSVLRWNEVLPADLPGDLDGVPGQYLGNYLWENEQLMFRGCVNTQQIRITYWSSGSAPTNPNQVLGIDDVLDLVATIAAANAASANGWYPAADRLLNEAFGASQDPDVLGGLMLEFVNNQIKTQQRGPQRRRGAFRTIRSRWGQGILGT